MRFRVFSEASALFSFILIRVEYVVDDGDVTDSVDTIDEQYYTDEAANLDEYDMRTQGNKEGLLGLFSTSIFFSCSFFDLISSTRRSPLLALESFYCVIFLPLVVVLLF